MTISGLEDARERTLEQHTLKELREQQEQDINMSERIKEWFKENWLGASALAASVASLITTVIVEARTAAVKGAQVTKSFVRVARDAIKKLGSWALPLAAFVYWMLSSAALSWLSRNLWVVVLIAVAIAYYYFRRRN